MPQKIYKVRFAIIAVLAVFVSNHYANTGKITGEINLNLQEEKIFARLKYDYVATDEPESHVKFYLNESFNVKLVECGGCRSFKFDRESERLPVLIIPLAKPLQKGERLMIKIEYDGSLAEMYHREFRFLELGLDWFWYPVHRQIGQFDFRYQLTVKTDMPEFQMAGNGRVVKQGKDWIIESKVPDYDINLVVSDRLLFKRYAQDGYDLEVVSKNLREEVATELLENIRGTLSFYNSTFGRQSPQREVTAVIRPFPETSGQGGYFRKGYFILPKAERAEQFFFPIAHELAHYWWIGADQQNAWLNESFAEYSAMLAVRKLKGVKAFIEILEKKKKLNKNLPPVYGFDRSRNREQSPLVLYVKGALKLYELEEELSKEGFLEFLRKLSEADVKDTDDLIELLTEFSSHEVAGRFLARLKG